MASYHEIITDTADARGWVKNNVEIVAVQAAAAVTFQGRGVSYIATTANATSSVVGRERTNITEHANATASVSGKLGTQSVVQDSAIAANTYSGRRTLKVNDSANATSPLVARRTINIRESAVAQSTLSAVRGVKDSVYEQSTAYDVIVARRALRISESANATSSLVTHKTANTAVAETANATSTLTAKRGVTQSVAESANATATLAQHLSAADAVVDAADAEHTLVQPGAWRQAFWVNTRTFGAAEWNKFNGNSIAKVGTGILVANDNGLAVMTDGEPVSAEVVWDLKDFGSPQNKRFDCAYMAGVSLVPVTVRVTTAQGTFEYQTHLTANNDVTNHRAPLGKGLTGRYARFGVKSNAYFAVNTFHVQISEVARRIGV